MEPIVEYEKEEAKMQDFRNNIAIKNLYRSDVKDFNASTWVHFEELICNPNLQDSIVNKYRNHVKLKEYK